MECGVNDESIVALFWNRDESAVAEAQKQYGAYCRYIAENVLGDERDAEECVNDALLSAWNSIPPKRPENLKAYLGMLVRNASVNRRLRNNAKKRLPKSLDSLDELGEIAAFRDVDGEVGARELARLISDFVRSLGTTERNVFIRRYWYYDSIDEICKRCGFGKSKVKMMLKRTRDSLAEYLKEEADYEL